MSGRDGVERRADTLRIHRHLVRWRVARGGVPPARSSLDEHLAEGLAAMAIPGGHDGVWLIRRLDVGSSVGAWWTPTSIARAVAAETAGALERVFSRGADGDLVRWFPSRAAFLGRFLVDCADGRARGRWEYAEFEPGAHTPSGAMRAAVAREPGTGLDALVGLSHGDLRRVLDVLEPPDAAAVLAGLAGVTGPHAADPAPLVVAALDRLLQRTILSEARAAALAVFLDVAREGGSAPPTGTGSRAREVVGLMAILRGATAREAADLAAGVAGGRWREVGAHVLSRVPELVGWPPDARGAAVRLLMQARTGEPQPARGPQAPLLATSLGGMFLLLPLLEELPWEAMTAGWPDLDGIAPSLLARFLALVGTLGADRNSVAVLDPVLRLALGLPPALGVPGINGWSRSIGPGATRGSTEAFVGGLSRAGKVSGAVTVAPLGDGVVAVDGARGIWLGTAPAAPGSIRALIGSIDAAIGESVAVAGSEAWIEACLPPGRAQPEPIEPRLLMRLGAQARHCALGGPVDLAPAVRDRFLVAAQALGRELAWRLPGFSRSSLPYLSDNVLTFGATVEAEPARFVVRVGDPPLHLLLSLAGLNRRRFHLDATGDREWVLTREL